MNTEVMFSSKTDQWSTPQDFFDKLNEEFLKVNRRLDNWVIKISERQKR